MRDQLGTAILVRQKKGEADALVPWLREACAQVSEVSGDEALSLLNGSAYDVLIMSVRSAADPVAFVGAVRKGDPDIEVVVTTGPADFRAALGCLRAGASDLVEEPVARKALVSSARGAFERRRARALASHWSSLARSAGQGSLIRTIGHEIANDVSILASSLGGAAADLDALEGWQKTTAAVEAGALAAWWDREGRKALDDMREIVAEAVEGVERLKLLSRDLRGIAHGDPSKLVGLDVGEVVQAALRVARSELTGFARLTVDVPPGTAVRANPGMLTEALLHVLVSVAHDTAAAKAGRGDVAVHVQRVNRTVLLQVEGDASPPAADASARYLAPHLPPGVPARREALGLAVACDLLQRQGGSLSARPGAEGGTVLEVSLPAADSADG